MLYLISGIKEAKEVKVGDTLTVKKHYKYDYRFEDVKTHGFRPFEFILILKIMKIL
jgi:translation elongation factor EF-4